MREIVESVQNLRYNNFMKTVRNFLYALMSIIMCFVFVFGVYGFFTAPAKAKQHQKEVEELILQRQKEAEEREKKAQEWQESIDNLGDNGEEFNPDLLYYKYSDSREMRIVGIGDSVMLTAAPQLEEVFPNGYFNVVYGRSIYDGMDALETLESQGRLGDVLVYSLGTNTYTYEDQYEWLIAHSGNRPVFFITTYGVSNDSNAVMRRVVARHDRVYMVEWESLALDHRSSYILSDALHPTVEGSYAYANLIADTINKYVLGDPITRYGIKGAAHGK